MYISRKHITAVRCCSLRFAVELQCERWQAVSPANHRSEYVERVRVELVTAPAKENALSERVGAAPACKGADGKTVPPSLYSSFTLLLYFNLETCITFVQNQSLVRAFESCPCASEQCDRTTRVVRFAGLTGRHVMTHGPGKYNLAGAATL
jgi:hypothetical protein